MMAPDDDVIEPQINDLRTEFHSELDSIRTEIAQLSARSPRPSRGPRRSCSARISRVRTT